MNKISKLPRSSPEEQGISSSAISRFLDYIKEQELELHSLMIVRHGHVIAEGWWHPYRSDREHMLFSLTKSFTSIAIGFAITEGLLSLEDTLASFFPEIEIKHKNEFRDIQVRDLLTLSAGHENATMGWDLQQIEGSWVEYFLNIPLDHEPGTRFLYNTSATQMLSAIVQRVAGLPLIDYLEPRLFEPLGISRPYWQTSPEGHNTGGHGMSLKTEDIAKFGQFLLQQGFWEGRQLLDKNWIKEASSFQIDNGDNKEDDWQQGYGFQFWLSRHGGFRADGAFSQFCIVLPQQDAVVIITSGTHEGPSILNLVWEHLLPAMSDRSLPADDESRTILNLQLNHLMLPTPKLMKTSPLDEIVSNRVFKMDANEKNIKEVSVIFNSDSCTFVLKDDRGEHQIICGYQEWIEGATTLFDNALHSVYLPTEITVCAKAGWRSEHDFEMSWCFVNTPFTDTVVCHFDGQQIQLNRTVNTDQSVTRPTFIGKMVQL
ncbi:serine hydrolase [Neobacillus sp. PS3-34]|uniref:serine hydrolase domain-containing protein n=1 Tax=Neobacillus sp. PS3-34 TaxID=3070678 RepID=UPI0027DEBC5C|nr:serine hydrolase [Neobacillus sp. PS3-34]WML49088.1 serine hydrolase [Neobacillus sp. PS3-34]